MVFLDLAGLHLSARSGEAGKTLGDGQTGSL